MTRRALERAIPVSVCAIALPAALALAVAAACVASTAAASGQRGATIGTAPTWAVVYDHVDAVTGKLAGLDLLRSGETKAQALIRRPSGSRRRDDIPTWSPDGSRIAFARSDTPTAGLYVVNAHGGRARRIARGFVDGLAWSPDGTRIALTRDCSYTTGPCSPQVAVAYLDGRREKRISRVPATTMSPDREQPIVGLSWAPDGRRLLCRCRDGITVLAADGSGSRPLTISDYGQLGSASWSYDGRSIAYERNCSPNRNIHDWYCHIGTIDPNTGSSKRVRLVSWVWMGTTAWTSSGDVVTALVANPGNGRGFVYVPTQIHPDKVAHAFYWNNTGGPFAAGRQGTFGYIDINVDSLRLIIRSRAGKVLVRHRLSQLGPDATIHID